MTSPPHETPAEARALDTLLARAAVPPPSPGLRRAILRDFDARATGFWRGLWREIGGLRIAAPALTASLALGISVASLYGPSADAADAAAVPGYAELALFEAPYEEYAP